MSIVGESYPYTYYLYTPLLLLSAVASLVLATVAWRRRPAPGAKSLTAMMVAGAFWGTIYALELNFREPAVRALFGELKYTGIVVVPFMWLIFALRYTGRDHWLMAPGKKGFTLLAAIPLITVGVALTNGWHHLLRSYEYNPVPGTPPEVLHGPWFWVHASYSYMLLLAGTFLLLSTLFRRSRTYQGQWLAVAVGSLVPIAANIVYVSDVEILRGLDPTPFAFTLTGGMLLWGCLHARLLELAPVAREAIVEEMADGLIVADRYGRVLDTNQAAQSFLGLSGGSVVTGRELADLLQPLSSSSLLAPLKPCQQTLHREGHELRPIVREIHLGEGQGQHYYELEISPLRSGNGVPVEGVVIVLRDVTERKRAETIVARSQQRLSYQAFHDPLTGLPNRYLFESRLEEALYRLRKDKYQSGPESKGEKSEETSKSGSYVAILFMDLDGFKEINDSLGHAAGDDLLRAVAERLQAGVRAQDTAARFGGDEFCVLLAGVSGTEKAVQIAKRLVVALREPFAIRTSTVRITASIGVAVGSIGSTGRPDSDSELHSLNELVREADVAMYRAKKKDEVLYEVVELWAVEQDEDPER